MDVAAKGDCKIAYRKRDPLRVINLTNCISFRKVSKLTTLKDWESI